MGIETKGELTLGKTVVDCREHFRWDHLPTVEVASDVNSDGFFDLLLQAIA